MDRWGQLDGRGIESEVLEVAEDGQERPVVLIDRFPEVDTMVDRDEARRAEPPRTKAARS
jgi:hypothetical protein